MLEDYSVPCGFETYDLPSKCSNEKRSCLKSYNNELERKLMIHVFLKNMIQNNTCKQRGGANKTRKRHKSLHS